MRYYETCQYCGGDLRQLARADSKYCDNKCRQAAYRARRTGGVTLAGKRNKGMIKEL